MPETPLISGAAKVCTKCGVMRPLRDYTRRSKGGDGLSCYCRPCCASIARHDRLTNGASINARRRELHRADPRTKMLNSAALRARRQGLPFDLIKSDIEVPDVCPALGIRLITGEGRRGGIDSSPSLDRLIPSLGYVRDNVVVVSNRANRIKNDSTIEELEAVATFFARHIAPSPSPRRQQRNLT